MIFSSLLFMFVFLPLVLIVYYLVPRQFRNLVLFVFSLVFYAWGEPVYILLMLFTAFIDYFNGAMVDKFRQRPKIAKAFVIESVIVNLSLLGFFKYAGLFTSTFNSLTGLGIPVPEVALPIGISFYTFESMSYTIDIYRDRAPRQHSIINYGAYVSFFPHLVAGPIVRYEDMALQLTNRKESLQKFTAGAQRFLVGLFKKVIIANNVAALADKVEYLGSPSTLTAWMGILAFTFQIYFDFSGYSDMAIGLAQMFGYEIPENFRLPYVPQCPGILAALAHHPWYLVQGICVLPSGRKPGRYPDDRAEYGHCMAAHRYLARRKLELCAVGHLFWRADYLRKAVLWKMAGKDSEILLLALQLCGGGHRLGILLL